MARYRALRCLLLGPVFIEPGEEFESDLEPGRNWEPIDKAAQLAVEARQFKPTPPLPGDHNTPRVAIPADWKSLYKVEIVNLARKLGAPKGTNAEQATALIEQELLARQVAEAA